MKKHQVSKVILFSWDFYPSNLVSSKRASYWAKNLKKYLPKNLYLSVITFNNQAIKLDGFDDLIILKKSLNNITGKIHNAIKLLEYLINEKSPSVIVLSAGPFYFLMISSLIPKRHRLIWDLRDPFVSDSKNKIGFFKLFLKMSYQKWFIKKADGIISINEFLLRSYCPDKRTPTICIPNGVESVAGLICNSNKKIIVLGKVYEDLTILLKKIIASDPQIEIHQYIDMNKTPKNNLLPQLERVFIHKSLQPDQINSTSKEFGIGLISSYPEDFVLPVKIFDYINLNQKLIIINDKNSPNTEIKRLVKDYENVFFIYNNFFNQLEFTKFINQQHNKERFELPQAYYREFSTKSLANFIKSKFL